MPTAATVLIPTHNHGPLLELAATSALEQTVSAVEVLIVGDGVDDATRGAAQRLEAKDSRVRFFDNPKGPRHGEILRHQALLEASGEIVCYLSDDDLWLPEHVETMADLLGDADFAHALPVGIWPDESVMSWVGHLDVESSRGRVIALENFIPLSCGAHTLEMYRRLPHGWRTTPGKTPTDVYMWSQIFELQDCRNRSGDRLTVLHFPSPWREGMTLEQRLTELEKWSRRMGQPGFEAELTARTVGHLTHHRTEMAARIRELEEKADALEGMVTTGREAFLTLESQLKETIHELLGTQEKLARLDEKRVDLEREAQAVSASHAQVRSQLAEVEEDLAAAQERERQARRERDLAAAQERERQARRERDLAAARERERQARRERDLVLGSMTWRVRNRLLRIPGLGPVVKWAGEARSRREDR